jgi:hypothetical protein
MSGHDRKGKKKAETWIKGIGVSKLKEDFSCGVLDLDDFLMLAYLAGYKFAYQQGLNAGCVMAKNTMKEYTLHSSLGDV